MGVHPTPFSLLRETPEKHHVVSEKKENKTQFGFVELEVIRTRVYCLLPSTHAQCDPVKLGRLQSHILDWRVVLLEILRHY